MPARMVFAVCGCTPTVRGSARSARASSGVISSATLFVGIEKGFTYRLALEPVERDAAQVLIRTPTRRRDEARARASAGSPT